MYHDAVEAFAFANRGRGRGGVWVRISVRVMVRVSLITRPIYPLANPYTRTHACFHG